MTNPYTSSSVLAPVHRTNRESTSTLQWVATTVALLAIVILLVVAGTLIPQAIRFGNEGENLPPRLKGSVVSRAIATASWVGGIAAVAGIVMNLVGLLMIRRGKTVVPLSLAASSIALMILIAIALMPV